MNKRKYHPNQTVKWFFKVIFLIFETYEYGDGVKLIINKRVFLKKLRFYSFITYH